MLRRSASLSSLASLDVNTAATNLKFVAFLVIEENLTFRHMRPFYRIKTTAGMGMRNPEDLIEGPCNPKSDPDQLKPYEPTERQRRLMGNDVENNLPFFAVGMLYTLVGAGDGTPLLVYTGAKLLHHVVYWTGQRHEVRATVWTVANSALLWTSWLVWKTLDGLK